MEKSLSELSLLQSQINDELAKYKQGIMEDKSLEDVKIIYLNIKALQRELNHVSDIIHKKIEEQVPLIVGYHLKSQIIAKITPLIIEMLKENQKRNSNDCIEFVSKLLGHES